MFLYSQHVFGAVESNVRELDVNLATLTARFCEYSLKIDEQLAKMENTVNKISEVASDASNKAEEALKASAVLEARVVKLELQHEREHFKSDQNEVDLYQKKARATSIAKKKLQLMQQQFLAQKVEYDLLEQEQNASFNRLSPGAQKIMENKENEENIHDELNSLV